MSKDQAAALGIRIRADGSGYIDRAAAGKARGRAAAGSPPHDTLWSAIDRRWPGRAAREFQGAVPGRRFRLDIAFPQERVAVEVDGWQNHGRSLGSFKKDRLRQNLLVQNHWRVLRFFKQQIYGNIGSCLDTIALTLEASPKTPWTQTPSDVSGG